MRVVQSKDHTLYLAFDQNVETIIPIIQPCIKLVLRINFRYHKITDTLTHLTKAMQPLVSVLRQSSIEITLLNGFDFLNLKHDLMMTIFHKQPWQPAPDRYSTQITDINIYSYISICILENIFIFQFKFYMFYETSTGIDINNFLHKTTNFLYKTTLHIFFKVLSKFQFLLKTKLKNC